MHGYVFTPEADQQLENLVDFDIRYQLEPEQFYYLIERRGRDLGTGVQVEGETIYIFITATKKTGPPPLAITYRILQEQQQELLQIIDIRFAPTLMA